MSLQVYLDGRWVPKEDAKVSIWDHGLLYGDGVFEGIRIYNSAVFKLHEHLDRLYDGAKVLMLEMPLGREELAEAVLETVRRNGLSEGYIRLVVTRGVGDLGLNPLKCPKPTVFIIADTIKIYPDEIYEKGMKVVTVSTRRNIIEALNPRIKSLNYLNNILATLEVNRSDAQEGLMLNSEGYVTECIVDNIFVIKRGIIYTPPISVGALQGVTRGCVMELASDMGYQVKEEVMTLLDVYLADELFLTGTAAEIAPITIVDERPIGGGKPGPVTKRLIVRFREYCRTAGVPVWAEEPISAGAGPVGGREEVVEPGALVDDP